jgi:hypothetical protein
MWESPRSGLSQSWVRSPASKAAVGFPALTMAHSVDQAAISGHKSV